jgi:hypothetical protein
LEKRILKKKIIVGSMKLKRKDSIQGIIHIRKLKKEMLHLTV